MRLPGFPPMHRGRLSAALAVLATVPAAGAVVVLASSADAAAGCSVAYQAGGWTGGFTANVRITAGETAVNGWTLTWTYAGDQRVVSAWNADVRQDQRVVTARNLAWNGAIAAGGSVEFGVQGSFTSANPAPADFALNGVACNGTGTTPTPGTPTPGASTASPTPTATVTPIPTTPSASGPGGTGCGRAVLCDGFESQTGSTPSGAWTVTYPNCSGTGTAAIDSGVARSGGKSVRVNGGAGYCNHVFVGSTANLAAVGPVWYARFYVRHTTPLPPTHTTFVAMRDSADGGRDLRIGGQNSALQWNRESDDATLPEQSPNGVALSRPLPTNQWTCVEYMVNGTAGTVRTWVGGTEVPGLVVDGTPTRDIDSQWLNRANWRPALTDLRLGWESYGGDADTLWFDDVVLGSTRIGC